MAVKKRILFVDQEPHVLDALQRLLRQMRSEWEMSFATNGQEASNLLSQNPHDIIVSDIGIEGKDGGDLLSEAQRRHPHAVRIALSGHTEEDLILEKSGAVHQFLAKPCDAETLKSTLVRACTLGDFLRTEQLQALISEMESLPSLPTNLQALLTEFDSPDASIKKIEGIISQDIGMMTKVLQLVNSAFFGLRQQITSPGQAVFYLGFETIKALTLSLHVFSQFDEHELNDFSLNVLWDHSLAVGTLAKAIAKAERTDQKTVDSAFIAGMLHDVGKLVCVTKLSEEYLTVRDLASVEQIPFHEAERKILKTTHAQVGAYLLGLWGFPDPVIEALVFHHTPAAGPTVEFGALTSVHAANVLILSDEKNSDGQSIYPPDTAYLERLDRHERLPVWDEIKQKTLHVTCEA
jgi:putative nucleotidyltransferase with HDIG domain